MDSTTSISDSDQYNNINTLVKKLGHELEEIRIRALTNLKSKLEHNVINESDLVQYKQLFVKLFEWFNFPQVSHKDKVLDLLYLLSDHKSAVRNIQEIGGVQFLNALKTDLDKNLQEKVDEIVERLSNVSSTINDETNNDLTASNITASINQIKLVNNKVTLLNLNNTNNSTIHSARSIPAEPSNNKQNNSNNTLRSDRKTVPMSPRLQTTIESQIGQYLSQTINSQDLNSQLKLALNESQNQNLYYSIFYWIPLTAFDRNFLATALSSLKGNDMRKIKSYCSFLENIVFNDFPAEIFLQRPDIIKCLFNLVISSKDDDMCNCVISVLNAFTKKLKKRLKYIKNPSTFCIKDFYGENIDSLCLTSSRTLTNNHENTSNHQNYNTNDNHNNIEPQNGALNISVYSQQSVSSSGISTIKSNDTNRQPPKTRNQNAQQQQQQQHQDNILNVDENVCHDLQVTIDTIMSESSPENYETDIKEKQTLQANEMAIHAFCIKLIDILFDSIDRSTSLLANIFETLTNLFNILHESKYEWSSLNLSDTLMKLFQKLNYHIKRWYSKDVNTYNRTIYVYLVNTLCNIINLMHSTNETSLLLPNELSETIFTIINDVCLCEEYEHQIGLLIPLLSHLDPKLYDIHVFSNQLCDSLNSACKFLVEFDSLDKIELVKLAKSSLNCLDYHICKQMPESIVKLCSQVMIDNVDNNGLLNEDIEDLLCACMSSNYDELRIQTYTQIHKLTSECLNPETVACEINSKRYKKLNFFLLNKIFYEFISFGLFDMCVKVKECAKKILFQLMECELLVSNEFLTKLKQLFAFYVPYVQCEASQIDKIGQVIIQLSDDTKEQVGESLLLPIEKIRCSLRYMYSKEKNLRKIGYRQSVGFFSKDKVHIENENNDLFCKNLNDFYLKYSPDKYSDMLVKLKKQKTFHEHEESIFQVENLLRIYNIFASNTVDLDVKKSACEQLSIMITDSTLHKAFINLGGLDYCINLLKTSLKQYTQIKPENDTLFVICGSCLTCLSNLFYWNKDIRQNYVYETQFYKLLFKYMMIFSSQNTEGMSSVSLVNAINSAQEDISVMLFMMVYHELSSIEYYTDNIDLISSSINRRETKLSEQYKLNETILKHIQPPFEVYNVKRKIIDKNSKYLSLLKTLDGSISEVLNKKFRIYWNIKWHGDLNRLIEDLLYDSRVKSNLHVDFSKNLQLIDEDLINIKSTNKYHLLMQLLDNIDNATTHQLALDSLDLIQICILIDSTNNFHSPILKLDWFYKLNRFITILPKSNNDQLLYTRIYKTISKLFDYIDLDKQINILQMDNWLFGLFNEPNSIFLTIFKKLLDNFEVDELASSTHLIPLCNFIKNTYRQSLKTNQFQTNKKLPIEIINYCIKHITSCETTQFRNLNKLTVLLDTLTALLNNTQINDLKLEVIIIKNLIQIINSFHVGRGGLSLSFMGNSITKSSILCLQSIIYNLFIVSECNAQHKVDLVKHLVCFRDESSALSGSSWIVPLMLHREPQIRSMSFSLTSLLVSVPFCRNKLYASHNGIWSIGLSVLLNRYESSIVRTQACALLTNLTQSMMNEDENNMSVNGLQLLLHEHNFYSEVAYLLSSFYPYNTYTLDALMHLQSQNNTKNNFNTTLNSNDISISDPLLISSIAELLYNLSVLITEETLLSINNNGIIHLLINYIKPKLVVIDQNASNDPNYLKFYEYLTIMVKSILNYLILCCNLEKNCIIMFVKNDRFVIDLIDCLKINQNIDQLRQLYSTIFDLLSVFLSFNEDQSISAYIINSIYKSWNQITNYIIDLLNTTTDDTEVIENSLRFYALYLSKITNDINSQLADNITLIYDTYESNEENYQQQNDNKCTGVLLCDLLIKLFDKYCMNESNNQLKTTIFNTLKTLFVLSNEAKTAAVNAGFIETLVDHLKDAHCKLNLKSLNSKFTIKDNAYINDLRHLLLICKSLMYNNNEIKNEFVKAGLHSIIHSFWCWSLQDNSLLLSILSTLCTYTANNRQGSSLMSQTTSFQQSQQTINPNEQRGIPLLQSIIKSIAKSSKYPIQKYGFGLLINCAQINECKALIWKSNILQDFSTDVQLRINNKPNYKKEKLWLLLLISISFTTEGQNYLMKIEGLLTDIIKCTDNPTTTELQYYGLLVLRNLSFSQSNKSKLLSHSEYVNKLLFYLQHKDEKFQKLAISTVDALLYDCQKAKVIMKNANISRYLIDLADLFSRKNDVKTLRVLKNLIKYM